MSRIGPLVMAGILTLGTVLTAQDGFKIVVNPSNPVSSMSKAQLSKLFLDKAAWDDGVAVTPIDLPPASPVREVFSREVHGLAPSAVTERWRRAASASGAAPPPAVASDREVLAYVRLKPGAIGYVSPGADVNGVKVLSIGRGAAAPDAIAVGGAILPPKKIHDVEADYPPFALKAKIQGTVELAVVIGTSGRVEKTRIVHSVPALDYAAQAAVKQWKYAPTLVNSEPVPVTFQVRVTFSLPPA